MIFENMNNGYVGIGIKREELEDSIAGLGQLKPMLQQQVIRANGADKVQASIDSEMLGNHFDTAIMAMQILLAGLEVVEE